MPFGARGVRPRRKLRPLRVAPRVSNAFRREGRSPPPQTPPVARRPPRLQCLSARGAFAPLYFALPISEVPQVSNAFRREGRSPLPSV